jgi:UDP-N-acetylglucosamine 4,6-dehydratase
VNNPLKSSVIIINGGTGSFGSTMVKHLLSESVAEIRVFSREETKQNHMRNEFVDDRIKLIIGDVRKQSGVELAIRGADYVCHAAALKQVPSCEFFPMQAVETNVYASANAYTSHNTRQLSVDEVVGLVKELPEFRHYQKVYLK